MDETQYPTTDKSASEVREPAPAHSPYMTFEEFVEFDEQSSLRNEYINGVVRAMNGPTLSHDLITGELLFALKGHLRGSPCHTFTGSISLRVLSDKDQIVYHPDLMVACNREAWGKNWLRDPKLVFEVLSPATRHIDRAEKAMNYRRISSVEEYILIEQDEQRVTVQRRLENWKAQEYVGPEAVAELRSIDLSISLAQIYGGVLEVNGPEAFAVKDPASEIPHMTFDEFLDFDAKSPFRHEYINGFVRAMDGPAAPPPGGFPTSRPQRKGPVK
jgi:Uma2 family endonuclease